MLKGSVSQCCDFVGLNYSLENGYILEFEYETYGRMYIEFERAWFYRQIKSPSSISKQGIFEVIDNKLLSLVHKRSYEILPLSLAKHFRIVSIDWIIDFIVSIPVNFRSNKSTGCLQEIAVHPIYDDDLTELVSGAIQHDELERYDLNPGTINSIKAPIEVRSLLLKDCFKLALSSYKADEGCYELTSASLRFLQIMDELLFNASLEKIHGTNPSLGPVYQIHGSMLLDDILANNDRDFQYRVEGANDTIDIVSDSSLVIKSLNNTNRRKVAKKDQNRTRCRKRIKKKGHQIV